MNSKVFSIRLPLRTIQGCFDYSLLQERPTDRPATAISRVLIPLIDSLIDNKTLPEYSDSELLSKLQRLTKINPASMPSLERASILDDSIEHLQTGFIGFNQPIDTPTITNAETNVNRQKDLCEEELERAIQEIELEAEVDLLSKILIS